MKKCKICGNRKTKKIGKNLTLVNRGLDIYRCEKCGTGFVYPSPTEKQLEEFYSSYDFDDDIENASFIHRVFLPKLSRLHSTIRAHDRAKYIDSVAKNKGKILEIGGARGELLNELKKKGWSPDGVEFSKKFIRECIERFDIGMHVNIKEYKNKKFDVIAMFHVLEHMINPIKELKKLSKYLSKKGVIIVEVPHFPKNLAHIFPDKSKPKEFHDSHTFHFTPEAFEIVAEKAGLEVVEIQRIINHRIFKSSSIYDLFPGRIGPSKLRSTINALYLVTRDLIGKRTTKNIENWKNIDYAGHGDFIRVIMSKK